MAVSSSTDTLSIVCEFVCISLYGVPPAATISSSSGKVSHLARRRSTGESPALVRLMETGASSRATLSPSPSVSAPQHPQRGSEPQKLTTLRLLSSGPSRLLRPLHARHARARQSTSCATPAGRPDAQAAQSQCCRLRNQDARGVGSWRGGQDLAGAGLRATAPHRVQGYVLN